MRLCMLFQWKNCLRNFFLLNYNYIYNKMTIPFELALLFHWCHWLGKQPNMFQPPNIPSAERRPHQNTVASTETVRKCAFGFFCSKTIFRILKLTWLQARWLEFSHFKGRRNIRELTVVFEACHEAEYFRDFRNI